MTSVRRAATVAGGLLLLAAVGGCGQPGPAATGGYSYESQPLPHPGIAEGRPVVQVEGRGTFYRCPEVRPDGITPLLTDPCLAPGDFGATRIDGYSMLEASVDCGDGRHATDLGLLGFGFAGGPVIPQRGASPDRPAVLECLGIVPPS